MKLPKLILVRDGLCSYFYPIKRKFFVYQFFEYWGIITFGYWTASPGLMKLCVVMESYHFFLPKGVDLLEDLQGSVKGNVLLRKNSINWLIGWKYILHISKIIVAAKIHNYRISFYTISETMEGIFYLKK